MDVPGLGPMDLIVATLIGFTCCALNGTLRKPAGLRVQPVAVCPDKLVFQHVRELPEMPASLRTAVIIFS